VTESPSRPARARGWIALAVALAVAGVVVLVVAISGQQSPPQPDAAAAAPTSTPSTSAPSTSTPPPPPVEGPPTSAAPSAPSEAVAEPVAAPVSISVPAIDVASDLLTLDLNGDGTVEVPPLGPDDRAGWYERGPAPGAVGPAVILGHVDSAEWGPGIFFDLGALEPGDEVEVARADGSVAVFAVDRVETHPKDDFPTIDVYGNTDDPQLRLITCGGAFDSGARSYEDNVIAYATLATVRAA
jgi:sortase (surface protein transpeptidase)